MKTILFATTLLAIAAVSGCKPTNEPPAIRTGSAAQQIDKAQAETQQAMRQMQDYAYEQKAEYAASMQTRLDDLNKTLDELSAKIATATPAVQAEARPQLAALRQQAAQLKTQLAAVNGATPSTWSGIKADSEKAYESLKEGISKSRQWVSEKIAP